MSEMSVKILKMVFFAVIVLVIGELFYLFVYLPNVQKVQTGLAPLKPTLSMTPTPTPGPVDQGSAITREIVYNYLLRMGRFKQGVLRESSLNNMYEGTLTEFSIDEKATEVEQMYVKLTLKGYLGLTNAFSYDKESIAIASIYSLKNNKKTPIKISDFKTGDKMRIISQTNLLKKYPNNWINLEFIRLD